MYWQDFLDWITPAAKVSCDTYNLPWQVLVAQGVHESGWGKYKIGEYNIFGRKWGGCGNYIEVPTWEVYDGQEVAIIDKFQDYDSLEQACDDWCVLITEEPVYSGAYKTWLNTKDIREFVMVLGPVYATDPEYSNKILNTIRECGLADV